ncbi:L,D-transpeptidase family protein [Pedobacter sp. KR3-3]|uniref:L,D-transpeptidase family protein n=1 Tax=Pedobacter albus TaxID=3113905 RepID=A0ABU7I3F9_9SPHI|nr:L,D-transpeptidase family protein [Pedobacter sp. KR3-3]MEE1943993.1 L,D-transpeptidase family protein [Pedobacter sp. KR3-3]
MLRLFLFFATVLCVSCHSNAQNDQRAKVLFADTSSTFAKQQNIVVTQGDLDDYLAYKKITGDTAGQTKNYLKILFSVKSILKWGMKSDYNKAVALAEENFRRRNLVNKVLVIKSERKMYLLKDGKTVKTFPVALGPNPVGQKEYEGDGRTPEGTYTLDWQRWNSSTFHSFHISYPNKIDSARAKAKGLTPGSNIMVHGTSKGVKKKKDWTNGCVALSNADMTQFRELVYQDTPIEIKK